MQCKYFISVLKNVYDRINRNMSKPFNLKASPFDKLAYGATKKKKLNSRQLKWKFPWFPRRVREFAFLPYSVLREMSKFGS